MLCNYGYEDGSGSYYIQIDSDQCCECEEKPCVQACPAGLFEVCLDDYDDEIVMIREGVRRAREKRSSLYAGMYPERIKTYMVKIKEEMTL